MMRKYNMPPEAQKSDNRLSELILRRAEIDCEYASVCIERARFFPLDNPKKDIGKRYIMRGFGDLEDTNYNGGFKAGLHLERSFWTLEEALWWLDLWGVTEKFDCEDDRIVVWEALPSGHRKPVWHCSGWHWNFDEVDGIKLEQGALNDDEESLYSRLMRDY